MCIYMHGVISLTRCVYMYVCIYFTVCTLQWLCLYLSFRERERERERERVAACIVLWYINSYLQIKCRSQSFLKQLYGFT